MTIKTQNTGKRARHSGFTIVELLIVIVVIAILAALSYVAYTSITNRAYDSSVKSDLVNLGKKISYNMADGQTAPNPADAELKTLGLRAARQSYSTNNYLSGPTGPYNLLYCTTADRSQYGFVAWSKSGKAFVNVNGQVNDYDGEFGSRLIVCPGAGINSGTSDSLWLMNGNYWSI